MSRTSNRRPRTLAAASMRRVSSAQQLHPAADGRADVAGELRIRHRTPTLRTSAWDSLGSEGPDQREWASCPRNVWNSRCSARSRSRPSWVRSSSARPKHRALLALLLLEPGRVVSVDRLIDQLWHGEPPAAATSTLQAYVSNLRRVLEPNRTAGAPATVLVTRPPGYVLDIAPEQVDAARFERNITVGDRGAASSAGSTTPPSSSRTRLSLWRGQPLADVAYESWAQSECERLKDLLPHRAGDAADDRPRARPPHVGCRRGRAAGQGVSGPRAVPRAADARPLPLGPAGRCAARLPRRAATCWSRSSASSRARVCVHSRSGSSPKTPTSAGKRRRPAIAHSGAEAEETLSAHLRRADPRTAAPARPARRSAGWLGALGRLLSGEPGIGKTRLCEELSAHARSQHMQRGVGARLGRRRRARVLAVGAGVAHARRGDARRRARQPRSQGSGADIARVVPDYAAFRDGRRRRTRRASRPGSASSRRSRRCCATSRRARPLVVVLDDLHWADQSSLRLLEFAVERVAELAGVPRRHVP